jgi:hypothetical protein
MAITLTTPVDGASDGTWGALLNAALAQLNAYTVGISRAADHAGVTTNTTVANDGVLALAVAASCVYVVDWNLVTDGATAGDFKYAWTGPASATMAWSSLGLDAGAASNVAPIHQDAATIGATIIHGTLGVGTNSRVIGSGLLTVAATAGTLTLQFAQGTSSASATRIRAGSWVRAIRIA